MSVRNFIAGVGALVLGAGVAVAGAAEPAAEPADARSKLIERPGQRLIGAIEALQRFDRLEGAYKRLAGEAQAVGVEVGRADPDELSVSALSERVDALRDRVRKAEDASVVAGVPRATLESIAKCESGGDPTAVSSDGTHRGKYQFDRGTWASLGGSGDPAAAPEAEQDYRAALLYQRAGSSPWPVCG